MMTTRQLLMLIDNLSTTHQKQAVTPRALVVHFGLRGATILDTDTKHFHGFFFAADGNLLQGINHNHTPMA